MAVGVEGLPGVSAVLPGVTKVTQFPFSRYWLVVVSVLVPAVPR